MQMIRPKLIGTVALAAAMLASLPPARAQQTLDLTADLAEILRLDRPAGTIVIGNPEIADATVGDGTTLVLSGRSAGMTNMIVLDQEGDEIGTYNLRVVTRGTGHVAIRYPEARRTFFCAPGCELIESEGSTGSAAQATASVAAPIDQSEPAQDPAEAEAAEPAPAEE